MRKSMNILLAALAGLTLAGPCIAEPQVTILSPEAEETIHENTSVLNVRVGLAGDLEEGWRIRLLLDGAATGPEGRSPHIVLADVERGEHTVQAQVVDKAGEPVASSAPVRFYMWQASRLFPSRQPASPPPPPVTPAR